MSTTLRGRAAVATASAPEDKGRDNRRGGNLRQEEPAAVGASSPGWLTATSWWESLPVKIIRLQVRKPAGRSQRARHQAAGA